MKRQTEEFGRLYDQADPALQHVLSTLVCCLNAFGMGKRDERGRFRREPTVADRFRELLVMFKKIPEFSAPDRQEAINHCLRTVDRMEPTIEPKGANDEPASIGC